MQHITVDIRAHLFPQELLDRYIQELIPTIDLIAAGNNNLYTFAQMPQNHAIYKTVLEVVKQKKRDNPSALFIIGIGGSNLGTIAIQQALLGSFYNASSSGMKIYYVDTLDPYHIKELLTCAEKMLSSGQDIIVNVISKSGSTIETLAAFELFRHMLERYKPHDYHQNIIVTTGKNSPLWHIAHEHAWQTLEIPQHLGGRYSVFSAVSLLPLAMLDIDIKLLLQGASDTNALALKKDRSNSPAASAAWNYLLCKDGYHITNMFCFSEDLISYGNWWRQLLAESLGKDHKKDGVPNKDVLVPLVSRGPADLHSIGQLYFANIIPISTTFIHYAQTSNDYTFASKLPYSPISSLLKEHSLFKITQAIMQGVKQTYNMQEIPYRTILLPEKNAYYIGQLLQHMMFEIVYLGALLGIDQFDQPAVELYKQETRKILIHE